MSWFLVTHFFQNWSTLIKIDKTDQNVIGFPEAPCSGVPQNRPLLDRSGSVLIKVLVNGRVLFVLLKLNCFEPFWKHPILSKNPDFGDFRGNPVFDHFLGPVLDH